MSKSDDDGKDARTAAKRLVYVVDDESMLLELATHILEPIGFLVETYLDPASALRAFTNANPRPALVITDYAMHQMNGMELIAALRRLEPNQRILLVSGTVGPEIFDAMVVKPDSFLAKPYRSKQLVELVNSFFT
jgi:CheY-like chemotaxis protein